VAGVFNTANDSVEGAQIAGVFSTANRETNGVQVSGVFNTTALNVEGAQIAGVFNVAGNGYSGIQIGGVFNLSNTTGAGPQIAGVFNRVEKTFGGFQIAGVWNWVGDSLYGIQIGGIFNRAKDVSGGQIGLINIGRDVKGSQIGLINISKSLSGLPIGLINISADGVTGVTAWTDSYGQAYGGIQFGTNRAYTYMVGGTSANSPGAVMSAATGMGLHFNIGNLFIETDIGAKVFFTQAEISDWTTFINKQDHPFGTAKIMAGIKIFPHLSFFGGLSVDTWVNGWNPGWLNDGFYPLGANEVVNHYTFEGVDISYVPRWFIGVRI